MLIRTTPNIFLLLLVASLISGVHSQSALYVSPKGSDASSGGLSDPLRTLQRACDIVSGQGVTGGDFTIYLRGGWHVLDAPVRIGRGISGQNGHQCIITAYESEPVVVSGGRFIDGWTLYNEESNIWSAPAAGLQTRQLYVNCVRAVRARSTGGLPGAQKTNEGYTTSDVSMQGWRNHSDIEFVFTGDKGGTGDALWTERRVCVQSIRAEGGRSVITMKQPAFSLCNQGGSRQGITSPVYIENAFELLDRPGEWYLDRGEGRIYYIPRAGENIEGAVVVAPVLESLVEAAGTIDDKLHDVVIRGITFAHATWLRPGGNDGFPEQQANYLYNDRTPGNITFRFARAITIEGCTFAHLGAAGLDMYDGCSDFTVQGNVFKDISGTAVQLGTVGDPGRSDQRLRETGNRITNNYIHHSPAEYHGGCGVMAGYTSGTLVANNEIAHVSYTAVSMGWGWGADSYARDNRMLNNHIHHYAEVLCDVGGFYGLSPQPNSEVAYNYIHDELPHYVHAGGALYPDEGSAYWDIHHNVVDAVYRWLHIWTASIHDITVRDNFTSCPDMLNDGANITMQNNADVDGEDWPQEARDIMGAAGPESDWRRVLNASCACSVAVERPGAAPAVRSAVVAGGTVVKLGFSEPLDRQSGADESNYSVNGGVRIEGVELGGNDDEVTLRVAGLEPDVEYEITVSGVQDRSTPAQTVAPGTSVRVTWRAPGLVLRWRCEEGEGGVLTDASGNGHDLELPGGGVSWVGDAPEGTGAIEVRDAAVSAYAPLDGWGPQAFTISFWMLPFSAYSYNQMIDAGGWGSFRFNTGDGGAVWIGIGDDEAHRLYLTPGTLLLNRWQQLTFTYEDGEGVLYRNGQEFARQYGLPAPQPFDAFGFDSLDARIDDVRVFERALIAGEVRELMMDTVGVAPRVAVPSARPKTSLRMLRPGTVRILRPAAPDAEAYVLSARGRRLARIESRGNTLDAVVTLTSGCYFLYLRDGELKERVRFVVIK